MKSVAERFAGDESLNFARIRPEATSLTRYTRRDVKKLSPEIIARFHKAGQDGDVRGFKQLLGEYGAHLSSEVKDKLI